ncbi:MAG: hypothetical protein ACKN81_00355, partial [Pirellulaceae bacterium]
EAKSLAIDRRAGCGKSASPVRREGSRNPMRLPYPIGDAVEVYASRPIKSIYPDKELHQRQVATAATRWICSLDVDPGSSTIWRWWLRGSGGSLRISSDQIHLP